MAFTLFISVAVHALAADATYYVDADNGNDNNSGRSIHAAWKTLSRINQMRFKPGDKIYLKRGQEFAGFLFLSGSGTAAGPIKLGAYGTGKRPLINATNNLFAIRLSDAQYWQISDIETNGGEKAGIFIGCTKNNLVLNHIRISNCYVHDVGNDHHYEWDYSKSTGGIVVVNGGFDDQGKPVFFESVFNDVLIDGCIVRYINRWTCISISSGKINGKRGDRNDIRNCLAEYSAADGIRMNGVRNSFIQYCIMYRNGAWPNFPAPNIGGLGAWFFDAENCTIQFCEASYVKSPRGDGGAFDIDYWQRNSTVQYCYGHDCHGYGVSVFGADPSFPTENAVVRYNIFSNNARDSLYAKQGDFYIYTWNGGLLNGVKIYNNTSFWNPESDAAALMCDADFTGSNKNLFKNNIIYSVNPGLVYLKNDSMEVDNNIYWMANGKNPEWSYKKEKYQTLAKWQEATGQDRHSRYTDPMLANPTYHDRGTPAISFIPKPGSPAINEGLNLGNMGSRDYWGNIVPDKSGLYDIGAAEVEAPKTISHHGKSVVRATISELRSVDYHLEPFSRFRGSPILLCFLRYSAAMQEKQMAALKAQLAFLKSIQRDYAEKGLKLLLVFEENADPSSFNNFIDDNELHGAMVWRDDALKRRATNYAVKHFPTSFLISAEGNICQRWDNLVLSGQLALAIEGLPGRDKDKWSTAARAIFRGLDAARAFSKNIWLVDGGRKWKKSVRQPVRLLLFGDDNRRIHLWAVNNQDGTKTVMQELSRQPIPKEESDIILANMPLIRSKLSIVSFPMLLHEKGEYTLYASGAAPGNAGASTGSVRIMVE